MSDQKTEKKEYKFGGLKEFNLEEIESEVLNDSVYLDVFAGSDRAFKTDLKSLENCLDKIMRLDGVSYDYLTEKFPEYKFSSQRQIGFIAQAVEKEFPELVKKDDAGYLSVNYAHFTPILVESVKSLSAQLSEQAQEIAELKKMVAALTKTLQSAQTEEQSLMDN